MEQAVVSILLHPVPNVDTNHHPHKEDIVSKDKKKKKDKEPKEVKVAKLAALACKSEEDFDAAYSTFVAACKPLTRKVWASIRIKNQVLVPLAESLSGATTEDAENVLAAIYSNPAAVKIVDNLHADFIKAQQTKAQQAKAQQEAVPQEAVHAPAPENENEGEDEGEAESA